MTYFKFGFNPTSLGNHRVLSNIFRHIPSPLDKLIVYHFSEETHFGFQNVSKEEKAKRVHGVFQNVASKYDLMNDFMSGGIHRIWKDQFVAQLAPTVNVRLLDVAGGTGDITFRILQYIKNEMAENDLNLDIENTFSTDEESFKTDTQSEDTCQVTVCDINEDMMKIGKKKAEDLGYHDIRWICGDAQDLPFPSNTFDAYTVAFGMRNVVDVPKAVSEAYRVLKPGGRFLCLEFSNVTNPLIRKIYDAYSFQLIPVIGQVVANDWDSYQYLVESIRRFPDQETFKNTIEECGFQKVRYRNLSCGITAIHSAFKV